MKKTKKLYLVLALALLPIISIWIYIFLFYNKTTYSEIFNYLPNPDLDNIKFMQLVYLKVDEDFNNFEKKIQTKNILTQKQLENLKIFSENISELAIAKIHFNNDQIQEFAIFKLTPYGNIEEIKKIIISEKNINLEKIDKDLFIYKTKDFSLQKYENNILANKIFSQNIKTSNIIFLSKPNNQELKQYIPKLNNPIKYFLIKWNLNTTINLSIQTIFEKPFYGNILSLVKNTVTNNNTTYTFESKLQKFFSQDDILDIEFGPIWKLLQLDKKQLAIWLQFARSQSVPDEIKNLYTTSDFEKLAESLYYNFWLKIEYSSKSIANIYLIFEKKNVYDFLNKFWPLITSSLSEFTTGDIKIINEKNRFWFWFKTFIWTTPLETTFFVSYISWFSIIWLANKNISLSKYSITKYYNKNTISWWLLNGHYLFEIYKNLLHTPILPTYQENTIKNTNLIYNLYYEANKFIIDIKINI